MIFDRIENLNQYGLDLSFIEKDLKSNKLSKGKFEIDGENCFGICLEYNTKLSEKGLWEAHRKYLDIHVVLEGTERIEISDIHLSKSIKEYEDDYELFNAEAEHVVLLQPGYFLILFPHEVHKTGVMMGSEGNIIKKVYKKKL